MLGRLEHDVLKAIRAQGSAAAAYLEGLYSLFPSPQTRTRMRVAKLLDIVYRAMDRVSEQDARSPLQRWRDFRQEVRGAQLIAYEDAHDPDLAVRLPGAVEKYREMLVHMMRLQEGVAGLEDLSRGAEHQTADGGRLGARLRQLLGQLDRALDRIETLAHGIDAEAGRLPPTG